MRVLAIALAFSSLSAYANCPNLAGSYAVCRSLNGVMTGSTDVVVTQKVSGGVTTYTMTSTDDDSGERATEEFIADGKTRSQTENDPELGEVVMSATYTCKSGKLLTNQSVIVGGEAFIAINQEIVKKNKALEISASGTMMGYDFQDTLICE